MYDVGGFASLLSTSLFDPSSAMLAIARARIRPKPPLILNHAFNRHSIGLSPLKLRFRTFASESATTPPGTEPKSFTRRAFTFAKYTSYICLSSVLGVVVLGTGIFIHDAFTYTEKHIDRVPINSLALHPEKGGPKNLPIVSAQMDDEEDEEAKKLTHKPKLVIVGGGWGVSLSFVCLMCC